MKSIEKALTSFLRGNGPLVTNEELCLYASKNEKQANEIIDILFSVINYGIDTYTGSETLDKVRHLLGNVNTVMLNNEYVDRNIVARKLQKLDYKLEHIQEEHKKIFIDYDTAIVELENTKGIVSTVQDSTVHTETKEYECIDMLANSIKNLTLFEWTSDRLPRLINAKDNDKNCLFKNLIIKYTDNAMKGNGEEVLYYSDLLSIVINNKEFSLTNDDKRECLQLIYAYINKFSINKKQKKAHITHIEFLDKLTERIKGEEKEKDIDGISKKYNISIYFSPALHEDAKIAKVEKTGYMTDRKEVDDYIITIDKDSSIEIDDGLSCEILDNGNYLLGVHVASPLAYFSYESDIIQEALNRDKSLFLPYKYQNKDNDFNQVIPIFPYEFAACNGSLLPDKKRCARSYYFEIDNQGNILREEFKKTIITSRHRTSYGEIDNIIKNGSKDKELENLIKNLVDVTKILDAKYKPSALYEQIKENVNDFSVNNVKNVGSQNIVNKTMLLTNNRVAEFFAKNDYPCLYRVHEFNECDVIKLEKMIDNLTRTYGNDGRDKLMRLLGQSKGTYPSGWYDIEGSHRGLGLEHYCHCTSALRRGADIVVEHALEICYDNTPTEEELSRLKEEVDKKHILFNNKQNSIDWFIKDYSNIGKRRR